MREFIQRLSVRSERFHFHTNRLGLARSILALSTLLLILSNPSNVLFHTGSGVPKIPNCDGSLLASINFFCLFSSHLFLGKAVALSVLGFVVTGYFPKVTAILHWWVAMSVNTGLINTDGGAQVAAVLSFLMVPLMMMDPRSNHWHKPRQQKRDFFKIATFFNLQVLKIQVAVIYFDAAVSKLFSHHWTEGTALFYFVNDPMIGPSGTRLELLNAYFDVPFLLVTTTYSIVVVELLLCVSLFLKSPVFKRRMLWAGGVFHILIFLIFGILTFSIAMFSALIFLLSPLEKSFKMPRLKPLLRRASGL